MVEYVRLYDGPMSAIESNRGMTISQSSVGPVSTESEITIAKNPPKPNRKFSFRRVYNRRATKTAASAGVPAITARQVV